MTPLERYKNYEEVGWDEFDTWEKRVELCRVVWEDSGYQEDMAEIVGFVDNMNQWYYPHGRFVRWRR